jgi:hypothetical protein
MPRRKAEKENLRKWVALKWYLICDRGDVKHLYAGTSVERIRKPHGAARYAAKYASKMRQKVVPEDFQNVGRLWGKSRNFVVEPVAYYRCTEDDIRGLLDGWQYEPAPDRPVYKVLYNCAGRLDDYRSGRLDKDADPEYTVPEGQRPAAPPKRQREGE